MLENRSVARRVGVLDHGEPVAAVGGVVIQALQPEARFVLRIAPAEAQRLGNVAGFDLKQPINRFSTSSGKMAARLGPDEWLLIAPEAEQEAVHAALAQALSSVHHALVDIGHRNTCVIVRGSGAAAVINAGCPLDLGGGRFQPGSASRTLFGKAEVVLFRAENAPVATGGVEPVYRIECWRSFGRYVTAFLTESLNDI